MITLRHKQPLTMEIKTMTQNALMYIDALANIYGIDLDNNGFIVSTMTPAQTVDLLTLPRIYGDWREDWFESCDKDAAVTEIAERFDLTRYVSNGNGTIMFGAR